MHSVGRRPVLAATALVPLAALASCSPPQPGRCIPGSEAPPPVRDPERFDRRAASQAREYRIFTGDGFARSPDGALLAGNQAKDHLYLGMSATAGTLLWDTATGQVVHHFDNHHQGAIAFHPGGRLLAVGGATDIDLLTVDGAHLWRLEGHEDPEDRTAVIRSLAFSPDGDLLASVSTDRTLRIWSVADQACAEHAAISMRRMQPESVAFSPDGEHLAVCGPRSAPQLRSRSGEERATTYREIDGHPVGLAFTADGTLLVGTGQHADGYSVDTRVPAGLYAIRPDGEVEEGPQPETADPACIAVDGSTRTAVMGRHDILTMVWDLANGERTDLERLPGGGGMLLWTVDGDFLMTIHGEHGPMRNPARADASWEGGFELP